MKKNGKKLLILGTALLVMFAIWTCLIQCVDVQSAGQKGTEIGFATFNCWFHRVTGVHMAIYTITDWLGLVPIFVSMKVLWIAVALMTLILVGVEITDVVTGRIAISKNYKEFSEREIDDSLIIECDVSTICLGLAASFGAFLLAGGTKGKRIALPNAEIMIHQPAIHGNGINGQVTDIKIVSDQFQKSKQRLNRILAENTGKTIEEICRDTERDNFMTATEALQYGVIDQVIEKR